jgi:anti-sigma regulatory factor (Ser/Thr protein kinase)
VTALELPPTTDSVPLARRFVRQLLADGDSAADVDTASLLVTEIVTNAVLHARTPVTVTVEGSSDLVRVEVHDGSPLHPRIHAFSATSATGRGLRLLDKLARRWGVEPDADSGGKVVWFEVGAATDDMWTMFEDAWLTEGAANDH